MAGGINRFRNLFLIVALLVAIAVQALWVPQLGWAVVAMAALAYGQNIAFSLVSRARTRNHAMYHFIASLVSNLVWFFMFRTLVLSKMPIQLAIPYTSGTVLGSLTGAQLSMGIERRLGIFVDEDSMSKEEKKALEIKRSVRRTQNWFGRVWYAADGKVKTMPFFLILGTFSVVQLAFVSIPIGWPLILLLVAGFVRDMAYGMRTWVQNRDNQRLLLLVNMLSAGAEFFAWGGLFDTEMPWSLFLPYTAVTTGGSLLGTFIAAWAGKKSGATADAHVKTGVVPKFSNAPYYVLSVAMAAQLFFFNPFGIAFVLLVIATSFMRNVAYTLVSRSRNRNHMGYHYVSSLFSNGMWFVTLYWFSLKDLDPLLAVPFIGAHIVGGIMSVEIAMRVEKRIGALADAHMKQQPARV